jgi:uncharacterized protein YjbI with pentapeptide repeats
MFEIRNRRTNEVIHRIQPDRRGAMDLRGTEMHEANLELTDLHGADLSGAQLCGALLIGANLGGANLSGTDLREADLRGAFLRRADLTNADLRGAVYDHTTTWPTEFDPIAAGATRISDAH